MTRITKECSRGHVFEPDYPDSDDCPYCAQMVGYKGRRTLPLHMDPQSPGRPPVNDDRARSPVEERARPDPAPVGKARTVSLYTTDVDDPVVGWLVATVGPLRGRDFKVSTGRSSIGRDPACRVCIMGDPTISSQQGFINYSRNRKFTISPGEGTSLLYLNGQEVLGPMELKAFDVLEMGATTMAFIPFCGENFDWSGEAN